MVASQASSFPLLWHDQAILKFPNQHGESLITNFHGLKDIDRLIILISFKGLFTRCLNNLWDFVESGKDRVGNFCMEKVDGIFL